MTTTSPRFQDLTKQRTVLLTTFRRDGTPVDTPVNIAVEGGRAYIRTWDTSGKLKRILDNPEVEVTPSTFRGRPKGPSLRARARLLYGKESAHAGFLIAHKHRFLQGMLVPLAHRLRRNQTVHLELTPASA